jgi:vacuolar-type H+-ATPase subunit I/STV1
MAFINGQPVAIGKTVQETLDNIFEFIRKQQLVIVDEQSQPMSEENILSQLQTVDVRFQAVPIDNLEQNTIETTLDYLNHATGLIAELIQTDDTQLLYRSFADFIESLLQLSQLADYFGLPDVSTEKVHSLSNRALAQMQLDNDSYIRDLLEYEGLPMLEGFMRSLEERKAGR